MSPTVLQVENVGVLAPYERERASLAAAGAQLEVVRCADGDELVAKAQAAEVIWLEWEPPITKSMLQRLDRCSLVMRWGVGYEQVDVAAATELGIAVANSPAHCTDDVAEHALALLLASTRQVVSGHLELTSGGWRETPSQHRRLRGRTVGVIGLGRIGRRVAQLCAAFGATVLGYDAVVEDVPGVRLVDLPELLASADFVTLHVPLTPDTRHLLDAAAIAAMKDSTVLVNTSRGDVVDESALLEHLQSGRISAALDVFQSEPLAPDSLLRSAPNVILTPHMGASSDRSTDDLRTAMCESTTQWLQKGWTSSIVNPEIFGRQRVPEGIRA